MTGLRVTVPSLPSKGGSYELREVRWPGTAVEVRAYLNPEAEDGLDMQHPSFVGRFFLHASNVFKTEEQETTQTVVTLAMTPQMVERCQRPGMNTLLLVMRDSVGKRMSPDALRVGEVRVG